MVKWNHKVSFHHSRSIVLCVKKQTNLWVGHFTTLWSFFGQLHQYLSQNWASDNHFDVPNMPKSYLDQKLWHKTHFFHFLFFAILQRKNTENLWLIGTISGHFLANYMKIFHKKEVQTVILRCLLCLNLNWIKI